MQQHVLKNIDTNIIAFTPGEPAGIGPNLAIINAQQHHPNFLVFADPDALVQRAKLLNLPLKIVEEPTTNAQELCVYPVRTTNQVVAGKLDVENANYVLNTIGQATTYCLNNRTPLLTGPIHKGIINQSGIPFSGHTEYLAQLSGVHKTVMMLATDSLKVALATTHLPLKDVSSAITKELLTEVIEIINTELHNPNISVLGLNPHAGEGGYLGDEEITIINPLIKELNARGFKLTGTTPADTAFTPDNLQEIDVVLAMYHDQGLPVLKTLGFKKSVNITLGLPFRRVSVDHGTALNLAHSTTRISLGSLHTAIHYLNNNLIVSK
jgi:4-hydroxythreonine-4-phosphate dehydrogenase